MSLKSISTVVTDPALTDSVIDAASAVATRHDAHLDVLCLGVDRSQMGYHYAAANAMILQEAITRAGQEAEMIEAAVRKRLGAATLRWGTDTGVSQMADLGRQVARHVRFSDLVVLPRPYGKDRDIELEPVVEAALFAGRAPVLIVPDKADLNRAPKSALLCWNESAEALSAIKSALPLLAATDTVHICVIDPPVHGANRSDPGGMLAAWLARHDIRAEIDVVARTLPRVSDVIRRQAEDRGAELIVMGAYGHSPFREAILGGATRDMLEDTDIPVLMAH